MRICWAVALLVMAAAVAAAPMPVEDGEDAAFADRGFRATHPGPVIARDDGQGPAWDFAALAQFGGPPPAAVHPSLWRHAALLARHGLFEVHPRVFQVRGFDISVMTVIVGDSGYIVVDPLTVVETARAAMALVRRELGDRPVRALIYTHSHLDHFGGAAGVVDEAEVRAGRVQVIAPDGFMDHAVAENLIAGNAMARRAQYQFATALKPGAAGSVSMGIGPMLPRGRSTLIPPTDLVLETGDTRRIDGVRFTFQMTPHTEAPAEMNFHLPDFGVLCLAENANPTMHNILTPRGALVRDAKAWADGLTQSIRLFGATSDILITSHGWPRFGRDRVADFIASHRDAYKFLHDQTVRRMNRGETMDEIAETLELPPAVAGRWFNRGYYGTMSHNSKAVYQRYLGWYSGNPASLHRHPPQALAARYVAAIGGPRRVLAEARRARAAGDHRWAATLLDHLVFAGSATPQARAMLADSHRRMAGSAESALWRNMYLMAAAELEGGVAPTAVDNSGLARHVPTLMLLDLMAVRLDPARLPDRPLTVALLLTDIGERHVIRIANGVMVHESQVDDPAELTLSMPRAAFLQALAGRLPAGVSVAGDSALLPVFLGAFETPPADFPIVTP